jgi:hypothetical protein
MSDLFFSEAATWFSVPAFFGTFVFLIRVVLMFLGAAGLDFHHDVHIDGGGGAGDVHHDSSDAFKLLSIQTITAFLMGFGWAGLIAYRGMDWGVPMSLLLGAAGGVGMVWLVGILLKAAFDLQTSGNIPIEATIGVEGTVYVSVPEPGKGTGQVTLVIGNRQRTYNAVSEGAPLATHTRIRVTRVNDDHTLTVAAV